MKVVYNEERAQKAAEEFAAKAGSLSHGCCKVFLALQPLLAIGFYFAERWWLDLPSASRFEGVKGAIASMLLLVWAVFLHHALNFLRPSLEVVFWEMLKDSRPLYVNIKKGKNARSCFVWFEDNVKGRTRQRGRETLRVVVFDTASTPRDTGMMLDLANKLLYLPSVANKAFNLRLAISEIEKTSDTD